MTDYIVYYRVSTQKQEVSGLGLEAQRAVVERFLRGQKPLAEFTDIQSGKKDNRENLTKALAMAKKLNATLLVSKLDRLSRSVTFISTLMDTKVKFVVAEMPELTELTCYILAIVAQHELKLVSERTKSALQAKKAQGFKLGKTAKINFTDESRKSGSKATSLLYSTNPNNVKATAMAVSLQSQGKTCVEIADLLNQNQFTTVRGKQFSSTQVFRLLQRHSKNNPKSLAA